MAAFPKMERQHPNGYRDGPQMLVLRKTTVGRLGCFQNPLVWSPEYPHFVLNQGFLVLLELWSINDTANTV